MTAARRLIGWNAVCFCPKGTWMKWWVSSGMIHWHIRNTDSSVEILQGKEQHHLCFWGFRIYFSLQRTLHAEFIGISICYFKQRDSFCIWLESFMSCIASALCVKLCQKVKEHQPDMLKVQTGLPTAIHTQGAVNNMQSSEHIANRMARMQNRKGRLHFLEISLLLLLLLWAAVSLAAAKHVVPRKCESSVYCAYLPSANMFLACTKHLKLY